MARVKDELIVEVSGRYGLLPGWLKALLWVESNLGENPNSRLEEHLNDLSVGPGQVLTRTALDIIRKGRVRNQAVEVKVMDAVAHAWHMGCRDLIRTLKEHEVGVELAAAYLAWQMERYGDIEAAVAAYNAGSARYKEDGDFVNQRYVDKWKSAMSEEEL